MTTVETINPFDKVTDVGYFVTQTESIILLPDILTAGKTYTLSAYFKGTGTVMIGTTSYTLTTSWRRKSFTFKANDVNEGLIVSAGTYYIYDYVLAEGNSALSPKDTQITTVFGASTNGVPTTWSKTPQLASGQELWQKIQFVNDITTETEPMYLTEYEKVCQETIETGKNLTVLDKYDDVSNLVTELYPTVVFNDKEYSIAPLSDLTLYDRIYTKHIEFEQYRPEFYQGIYDRYTSLIDKIDTLNTQCENLAENTRQLKSDLAETATELTTKRSAVAGLEDYYRDLLKNSQDALNSLHEKLMLFLNFAKTNEEKTLNTILNFLESKETALKSKKDSLKSKESLYDTYNSKSTSRKQTKKAQEGYRKKAKAVKKEIDKLKKEISAFDSTIRKQKTAKSKSQSNLNKIEEYMDDLSDPMAVSSYDIASIIKCLKSYGIQLVSTIAKLYTDSQENIENKDDYQRDIEDKYEAIYELKSKFDEIQSQISCNDSQMQNTNEELVHLSGEANSTMTELENAICGDLLIQATAHLNKYKYPQVTYEVESLPIDAKVGDSIPVKHDTLKIDIETSVVSLDYDCIGERVEGLQFGNTAFTIKDMMEQINTASNQAIANSQVQLTNMYSNIMSKVSDISGAVAGITTETIFDGNIVETDSKLEINQGKASLGVTQTQADKMIDSKVEVAVGQIESTVTDTIVPQAMANVGAYSLTITTSNGTVYDDDNMVKTLYAKVVNLDTDITSILPSQVFSWTRKSTNSISDSLWNSVAHYGSELNLTASDYDDNCSFCCEVYINVDYTLKDTNDEDILDTNDVPIPTLLTKLVLRAELGLQSSFKGVKTVFRQLSDRMLLAIDRDSKTVALIDMISGQTSTIKLKADNIVWEGMITANGNVIICEDGSLECNKGKFNDNVSIKDKLSIHTQYKDLTAGYDVECLMDALSTTISQYGMSTKYLELLVGKPDNTVIYSGPNAPDLIAGGIRVKGMLTLDEEPFVISDMDAKDKFTDLDERYYNLAEEIHYLRFVYRYGRSGRYHVGIVAQDFEKLLEKHKIDTEELAILGIDGKGKRSIRYGELGNLMGWYAKERMNRQDTKIADLEERLLKLEESLGD